MDLPLAKAPEQAGAGLLSGISVVVPVYRSMAILPELHRRLTEVLSTLAERFEIILVEDCGGDSSWTVIQGLAARDERVRGIRMSRNYGQHNALLCGIRAVRYATIVTLDDDLQNPPEEIGKLLAKLSATSTLSMARPRSNSTDSCVIRRHGSRSWRCRAR